ncbi:MAG: KpsF/GutQ family sugar-phosphate isomerase [Ferruginibacter sp.]
MSNDSTISSALRTIEMEAAAIAGLRQFINEDFTNSIRLINNCKGRLVVSGIGKSAIVAQKIVATLNSTGTSAVFMHAADAIHGDIGMLQPEDIVMVISKSGDSPEIKVLVPLVKNFGNSLIGMVGNIRSFLATHSHYVLNTTVEQEACPNNLAPTSSTTAQMVMGDALAICLMELKGFGSDDFAKVHPGGMLGKKLYLRVADLYPQNERPVVKENTVLKEVIIEMTRKRLGAAVVADDKERVKGIITDGDLRRMLENNDSFGNFTAKDLMIKDPKTVDAAALAVDALDLMRQHNISQLIVVEDGIYKGIVHLHDLVREGII